MRFHDVNIPEDRLAEFCARHGVSKLSVFGSILRDDFGPQSDVDVLVEFPLGGTPSLLVLGGMLMELREMFGRDVDLLTPGAISPLFRDRVMSRLRTLYAA